MSDSVHSEITLPSGTANGLEEENPSAPGASSGKVRERFLIFGLLLGAAYLPLLVPYFYWLWAREPYRYFPLALGGAAFLAWERWQDLKGPLQPGSRYVAWAVLGFAWILLAPAVLIGSPWIGAISALFCGAGAVWWLGGWTFFRAMLPAGLMFLTIIHLPMNLDEQLTYKLRTVAVTGSSSLLDWLQVTHSLQGHVVELPGQRLLVEEACSGINSVLTVITACLLYELWQRRSVVQVVLALPLSVGFVLLGNLARITLGAWLNANYRIDILSGWRHEMVGVVLFISYLGLILSADRLLYFFFARAATARPGSERAPAPAIPSAPWLRSFPRGILGAGVGFALLGVVRIGLLFTGPDWGFAASAAPDLKLAAQVASKGVAAFQPPPQLGNWKLVEAPAGTTNVVETRGILSRIWHYQSGDLLVSLALDYPYLTYHDLTICYVSDGWKTGEKIAWGVRGTRNTLPYLEVQLFREPVDYALLCFGSCDERGQWFVPPEAKSISPLLRLRMDRSFHRSSVFQVQVLATNTRPLRDAEVAEVRQLFESAREVLAGQMLQKIRAEKGP